MLCLGDRVTKDVGIRELGRRARTKQDSRPVAPWLERRVVGTLIESVDEVAAGLIRQARDGRSALAALNNADSNVTMSAHEIAPAYGRPTQL